VQAYHAYQVDMAVLYGADRSRAEKEMREVLDFEFALANVSSARVSSFFPSRVNEDLLLVVDFTSK
jgi:hypothetical protein